MKAISSSAPRLRDVWRVVTLTAVAVMFALPVVGQQITTPMQALGFNIGDDYHLATYSQLQDYWATLARESPRMVLQEIGKTEEGRPQLMAILTSPENHRNLDRYRRIAQRLALAEDLSDAEAMQLAQEGKPVVWIDGGLHATEVLGAHQLMQFVYEMVSQNDPETLRFLDEAIILAVHANPDGMELVSNWYMREADPQARSSSGIPVLYQKYVGHDNNRDFYMSTQAETQNMNRIMYRTWYPQIVYNHHQTGPAGTVMFAPPFRDPFNYNYHSLLPLGIEAVGTAMHSRFVREGKPGTTMRSGASYSTWWNGGLRTTPYFHNMIGLLTETIGNPTPIRIPLILDNQLPRNDLPFPIEPQQWHFRSSVEYSQTANRAVLNYATRNKIDLLYNIYVMGRDAIAKGNRDTWRVDPSVIASARDAARQMPARQTQGGGGFGARGTPDEVFTDVFRDPDLRDPRGYIIPSNQADFQTATKFVNVLIHNGITVHEAGRAFTVEEKQYPQGSYVVKTAQAFRPFVLDMFEPQVHPNDFAYPGGPPISPYDNTGWTVAYQMGIDFDRILNGFDGPFERIDGFAETRRGVVSNAGGAVGFIASHRVNDVFVATNRLMNEGEEVYWIGESQAAGAGTAAAGSVYIAAGNNTRSRLESIARELGVSFQGVSTAPTGKAMRMRNVRVGLWDQYGGSMPSGWARWLLEQFEFDYEVVYPQRLDRGNLNDDFDVLIFVNGGIPSGQGGGFGGFGRTPDNIPAEFQNRLGSVTADETVPQLEAFLQNGGSIITIGNSTSLAYHIGTGLENYMVDYEGEALTREQYFVPGSIARIRVDNTQPIAWGMPQEVDVHFNNSPVFELTSTARNNGVKPIGWFETREPLRSGWAWGQHYLNGGVTMAETKVGEGTLYLFGPEIIRRGQPHGTFKFFFNGIYLSGAEEVSLVDATSEAGR